MWFKHRFGQRPGLEVLALLLIAALMLGAGMGFKDPWPPDEPRFALVALEMIATGDWLFPHRGGELYADKPPLFMWSIAAAYLLTGSMRVAHLLPSWLAALGVLLLVYDLGRRLWNRRTGLAAAGGLLLCIQFSENARTAQVDMLLTFWCTLGLYGLARHLLLGAAALWLYLAFAAMGLGVLTKGVGVLPLLMLPLYFWAKARGWRVPGHASSFSAWLGALLAMGLVIGLWIVPLLWATTLSNDPAVIAYRDNLLFTQTGERYLRAWGHIEPPWFYLTHAIPKGWVPLILLLPWLVPAWVRRIRRGDIRYLALLGYVIFGLLFFSASAGKRDQYILPLLPALALAAAPLVPPLLRRAGIQRLGFGIALLASAAACAAAWHGYKPATAMTALGQAPSLWQPLLALGLLGLALAVLARPERGVAALCGLLFSAWCMMGLWIYPLVNDARSAKAVMERVTGLIPAGHELALVQWREQFGLMAKRPFTHFGYNSLYYEQAPDAAAWLRQSPAHRWVLIRKYSIRPCFEPDKLQHVGRWHTSDLYLARADALAEPAPEECSRPAPRRVWVSPEINYQP